MRCRRPSVPPSTPHTHTAPRHQSEQPQAPLQVCLASCPPSRPAGTRVGGGLGGEECAACDLSSSPRLPSANVHGSLPALRELEEEQTLGRGEEGGRAGGGSSQSYRLSTLPRLFRTWSSPRRPCCSVPFVNPFRSWAQIDGVLTVAGSPAQGWRRARSACGNWLPPKCLLPCFKPGRIQVRLGAGSLDALVPGVLCWYIYYVLLEDSISDQG